MRKRAGRLMDLDQATMAKRLSQNKIRQMELSGEGHASEVLLEATSQYEQVCLQNANFFPFP